MLRPGSSLSAPQESARCCLTSELACLPETTHSPQEVLPAFRPAMQAYWNAVEQLGMQLIALLAEALGLDVEAFLKLFDKPMLFLRPLHYSSRLSVPDQVSDGCNSSLN